ncbi:hypothetical protein KSF78_0008316 [Schistosoma japonicum]|nr:hypothetical protein KSF78_0008316 [Schistosoma japonicum]
MQIGCSVIPHGQRVGSSEYTTARNMLSRLSLKASHVEECFASGFKELIHSDKYCLYHLCPKRVMMKHKAGDTIRNAPATHRIALERFKFTTYIRMDELKQLRRIRGCSYPYCVIFQLYRALFAIAYNSVLQIF